MRIGYRIRRLCPVDGRYEYSNGNATLHYQVHDNSIYWGGTSGTWSRKGKIFFGRKTLREYLDRFVDCAGELDFLPVADWEIEEIGVGGIVIKTPQEFYHTWEHLTGKPFTKETA
jgi:hypothetical protein